MVSVERASARRTRSVPTIGPMISSPATKALARTFRVSMARSASANAEGNGTPSALSDVDATRSRDASTA